LIFNLEMAHFDAYLRHSDVLILFCSAVPARAGVWVGKFFDYLILKWRILMHISGILT